MAFGRTQSDPFAGKTPVELAEMLRKTGLSIDQKTGKVTGQQSVITNNQNLINAYNKAYTEGMAGLTQTGAGGTVFNQTEEQKILQQQKMQWLSALIPPTSDRGAESTILAAKAFGVDISNSNQSLEQFKQLAEPLKTNSQFVQQQTTEVNALTEEDRRAEAKQKANALKGIMAVGLPLAGALGAFGSGAGAGVGSAEVTSGAVGGAAGASQATSVAGGGLISALGGLIDNPATKLIATGLSKISEANKAKEISSGLEDIGKLQDYQLRQDKDALLANANKAQTAATEDIAARGFYDTPYMNQKLAQLKEEYQQNLSKLNVEGQVKQEQRDIQKAEEPSWWTRLVTGGQGSSYDVIKNLYSGFARGDK